MLSISDIDNNNLCLSVKRFQLNNFIELLYILCLICIIFGWELSFDYQTIYI